MAKSIIMLILIGSVCATLLTLGDQFTAQQITDNRTVRARALMQDMLSAPLPPLNDPTAPIIGQCDDWLFVSEAAPGYAGEIAGLGLWHADGQGLKVRVTSHRETPGIGDFIDHIRTPWITRWDSGNIQAWTSIDTVSGATITSDAVRQLALQIFQQVEKHCAR